MTLADASRTRDRDGSESRLRESATVSPVHIIGLPLLYASAYFLPPLGSLGAYALPTNDTFSLIVLPTVIAVCVGSVIVLLVANAARKWFSPWLATIGSIIAVSIMMLLAVKGLMDAAGFDWQDRIPRGNNLLTALRLTKYGAFLLILTVVAVKRRSLPNFYRLLGILGIAFALLAAVRLLVLWQAQPPVATASLEALPRREVAGNGDSGSASVGDRTRRVVWVIFDESDFDRLYAQGGAPDLRLTNFNRLAQTSVFATSAHSPASATLYSIPSLLTGKPIGGGGLRIDQRGVLKIEPSDESALVPFGEKSTIFGALAEKGRGASILGFFHPYCKLFELRRCDSFPAPIYGFGHLDAAIWANIPDVVSEKIRHVDDWKAITQHTLQLLPEYLNRDDALTFIHLNLPHLPATYAEEVLGLLPSGDPLTEYSRNLMMADRILGEIVQDLQTQLPRHELMLIVSTDHWLRNRWYRPSETETSRRIPLIIWKVGESDGVTLSNPLSTVNTGAFILDYLDAKVSTQAEMAQWWSNSRFYPSFIVPRT